MLLLEEVNPPPIVVPPTLIPGLAGKVNVQDCLLDARDGVIHIKGLRIAVSEHFLIITGRENFFKSKSIPFSN
jgi:hypothetical protein